MEYRIAQGWRIFVVVFATAFFIGGIFCLLKAFKPDTSWPAGLALFMAVFLMGLAVLSYLDTMRTLVTVDQDVISVVRLFRSRSALLAEIDGYRKGEKDMFYVVLKSGGRPLQIPQYIERRKELLDWIREKYEDVDARERTIETKSLLENDQFGLTREDREARLGIGKKIDVAASVGGFGLFAWSLFYPRPYELMMIILFIAPWIAIYVTWYFKGLLKLYKKKSSPYPSAVLMMCMPPVSTGVVIIRSYDLYDFGQHAWSMLIGGAILAAALCIIACRQAIALSGRKALTYICVIVMAGVYSISLLIFSNCYYDESASRVFRVEVSRKHKEEGKRTTYYVSLSPWGRFEDGNEVSVSKSFYQSVSEGDSIRVLLNNGKWGVPWYWLRR
jgi:hypothetical protein